MSTLRIAVVTLAVAAVSVSHRQIAAQAPPPHAAEHHEFVIDNFRTESGVTLPKARIVYGTYGRLNAARDNAVLLPSHYMANHHGYDWLIGARPRARSRESCSWSPPSCSATAIRRRQATRPSHFTARAFR